MPGKRPSLIEPAPRLTPSGRYLVVVDYLDAQNRAQVVTFQVKNELAGRTRLRKIASEGLELLENGMTCLYPPHRLLKLSVGEEFLAA